MAKKRNIHRVSDAKRNKPFIRFNFWLMVIIFGISFLICFILYMIAANLDDDFFDYESSSESSTSSEVETSSDDENVDIDVQPTVEPTDETPSVSTVVNPVPESSRVDDDYFDDTWILTDSSLLDIKYNTSISNVIGNANLTAANVNQNKIETVYGTITAYQNLQIVSPKNLYIMLGSDIGTSSIDDMINGYSNLIADITSSLPNMNVYIMQLPPIYTDSDTVTNEMINDYNSRLIELADNYSVYCIDTNTILKNNTGTLDDEYYSYDENSLSVQAYSTIYEYILTHIVS